MSQTATALHAALGAITQAGAFCVTGDVSAPLPGLEVDGMGPVGLPLNADSASKLIACCRQAPYGKGALTLLDTSVRRVWQLDPERIALTNPAWPSYLARVVKTVQQELGLENHKLNSDLYNLLVYEPGSFFLPHRDGEKLDRMVATLVIVLPTAFTGGELVVRHDGQQRVVDFSPDSAFQTQFVAFYADCEHEIRPLKTG